jgi:hypothetical protein
VLAVEAEPASLLVPADVAFGLRDEALSLQLRPRIFDPRGGEFAVVVSMCGKRDPGARCEGDGLLVTEQTLTADADDPLGMIDLELEVTLTAADLAVLYRGAGFELPTAAGVAVDVNVSVVREVNDFTEREVAVSTLLMRADPTSNLWDDAQLATAGLVRCASLDDDDACTNDDMPASQCGNNALESGEACDPPGARIDDGECDDACFRVLPCPTRPVVRCVRAAEQNQRPHLVGLQRSPASTTPVYDAEPDLLPDGTISVDAGETVSLNVVLRASDAESRIPLGFRLEGPIEFDEEGDSIDFGDCVPAIGFGCPSAEQLGTMYYVSDDVQLFGPDIDGKPSTFQGNFPDGAEGISVKMPSKTGRQHLVVVTTDGNGGMDAAVFHFNVR